ncbi:MAG: hypothetical protein J2P54_00865 [Bradyrhizobiaceae bacterium]|nr:hypothetical protein [Bradyrhizobiaceae bacterium]
MAPGRRTLQQVGSYASVRPSRRKGRDNLFAEAVTRGSNVARRSGISVGSTAVKAWCMGISAATASGCSRSGCIPTGNIPSARDKPSNCANGPTAAEDALPIGHAQRAADEDRLEAIAGRVFQPRRQNLRARER